MRSMPRFRRRHLTLIVLGPAILAGACSSESATPARPAPPDPPAVEAYTLTEFGFAGATRIAPGRVVIRLVNEGDQVHQPALVAVPDDVPPIVEQLRGTVRRNVDPVGGVNGARPGATSSFAVDLEPGRRYAFVCYAETEDPQTKEPVRHANMGMALDVFTTGTAPTTTVAPGADDEAEPPAAVAGS